MILPRAAPAFLAAAAFAACGCGGGPAPTGSAVAKTGGDGARRVADAVERAKSLEMKGDLPGAEAAWEEVLAARQDHASALYATVRLRRRRGDLRGALDRIDALCRAEPVAGRGWMIAAEILSDPASGPLRDPVAAEAAARAALARNPEESGPHLVLGRVLLLDGRTEEAAARLAIAARMNPKDADGRSLLGAALLRQGREAEARTWFREAIRCGRAAGAGVSKSAAPSEGDTAASLAEGRPPSPGELRAAAGLACLGEDVGGARDAGPLADPLRARGLEALRRRGTGEALLDADGDGAPEEAFVEGRDGTAAAVRGPGGSVSLYR